MTPSLTTIYILLCGALCIYGVIWFLGHTAKRVLEQRLAEFLEMFDEDQQLYPYREIALMFHEASRHQADGYYQPRLANEAKASLDILHDEGVDEVRIGRIKMLMDDILHRLGTAES